MKKPGRICLALLICIMLAAGLTPGTARTAELRDDAEEAAVPVLSRPFAESRKLLFGDDAARQDPSGGLSQTRAPEISEETRNAVGSKILTGLKNRAEEIDVSAYGLTVQEGCELYNEVLDAHYELFYVKSGYGFNYAASGITSITPYYDPAYTGSDVAAFNDRCMSILAGLPQGTNVEKLLYLHDYLITHCEYDASEKKTNAFNALVEGSAVCDGYSKAFKCLCDLAGLTCEFVSSYAIDHSWNMVQVNKEDTVWYYIDCTWDDPTNGSESLCKHVNFLLSREACANSHDSSDWTNGRQEYVYDRATSTKYDNYWWKDLNRSVQWVGTMMCYARSADFSHVYFRSSGASSETAVTIQGGGKRWHVWGSYRYWSDSYITVAAQGGAFYYSTRTEIWKLTTGGEMTLAYTLTSDEKSKGYIYGIQSSAGGITYYIGRHPLQPGLASGILSVPLTLSSIEADKTTANAGEKITWTAAASCGTGDLQYYFIVYKDGVKIKTRSYSTVNTFSYTPLEAGSYKARVYVKDAGDNKVNKLSAAVTVTLGPPAVISVKAGLTSANAGEKLTWTATAVGSEQPLQYYFILYKDGVKIKTRSYSTANTFSYTPLEAGSYRARVYVKDAGDNKVNKLSAAVTVTLGPPAVISVKAGLTSAYAGEKLTWTATAVGSEQPLQYYFILYKDGVKVKTRSYSTADTFSYTPTEAGTYRVRVYVKDAADNKVNKLSAGVSVVLGPTTLVSVKAGKTGANVGEKLTWTATAVGSEQPLQYYFILYKDGVKVKTRSYSTADTFSYTPTEAGAYRVRVYVKDASGTKVNKLSAAVTVS